MINTDACTNMCKLPVCGDGIITPGSGEECEDGNNVNSDKCNACKKTTCGDGIVQTPNGNNQNEGCDDGNKNDNDFCSNLCQFNPG
jgi:cysteine-rich repeat protein